MAQIMDLIKAKSSFYKLEIPEFVEAKIRYLCNKVYELEWSGILFYSIKGEWDNKKNPLTVVCKDILVQDIGTAGFTEFNFSAIVMNYAMENDLLDYYHGLIHSHNNMATFFSRTDTNTLLLEGQDTNHFVSLIVNNAGTYTAGITRHITSKLTMTESYNYPTFEDKDNHSQRRTSEEKDYIEWFNLAITVEKSPYAFEDIDAQLTEIRENKRKTAINIPLYKNYNGYDSYNGYSNFNNYNKNYKDTSNNINAKKSSESSLIPKQTEIPFNKYDFPISKSPEPIKPPQTFKPNDYDEDDAYYDNYDYNKGYNGYSREDGYAPDINSMDEVDDKDLQEDALHSDVEIDEKLVLKALYQICTCSPIIPNLDKFNFDKWSKVMPTLFEDRFKNINMDSLKDYLQSLIDLVIREFETLNTINLTKYSDVDPAAVMAYQLREYIRGMMTGKNLNNKYFEIIEELLSDYIY